MQFKQCIRSQMKIHIGCLSLREEGRLGRKDRQKWKQEERKAENRLPLSELY